MKSLCIFWAVLAFTLVMASTAHATDLTSTVREASVKASFVNQNPDPARAGETVELKFMVENQGGEDLHGISLELVPSYPFATISGENYVRNVSVLQGYQSGADAAIVKFTVMVDKDASAGTNAVYLRHINVGSSIYVTDGFNVDITGKEFAQIVFIDKSKISPGNETDVRFTINNVGASPLRNLVFSWNEPKGAILPVFSDDTKYVKYIGVGGSADLDYRVVADVNANPGLYLLNLDLKFDTENGTTNEVKTRAGMFVGGETDFDIAYSESSAGQTSLSVANTGNNPAYSVTVRIPEQDGFTTSGSTSSIIGNLDKGDYTIVSFQVSSRAATGRNATGQFSQGAPSGTGQRNATAGFNATNASGNLKVLVEYTDTVGERHSVEKAVLLRPSTNSTYFQAGASRQSSSSYATYVVIAAAGAAAVGGWFFYRRRKARAKRSVSRHEAHEGRQAGA